MDESHAPMVAAAAFRGNAIWYPGRREGKRRPRLGGLRAMREELIGRRSCGTRPYTDAGKAGSTDAARSAPKDRSRAPPGGTIRTPDRGDASAIRRCPGPTDSLG